MNKWGIIHIHSTPVFYVETQIGKKPRNDFSYMTWGITFIGSTNFLCFPAATGGRLQPPSFSGYNLREAPTPQFSGYNQKEATTPYVLRLQPEGSSNSPILWLQPEGGYNPQCSPATTGRWLQPPILSPSCHPEVEVEWWNHCHTITVRYIAVNLYQ